MSKSFNLIKPFSLTLSLYPLLCKKNKNKYRYANSAKEKQFSALNMFLKTFFSWTTEINSFKIDLNKF